VSEPTLAERILANLQRGPLDLWTLSYRLAQRPAVVSRALYSMTRAGLVESEWGRPSLSGVRRRVWRLAQRTYTLEEILRDAGLRLAESDGDA
jgi:DNA-binding IclR family transcriptional regulator